MNINRRWNCRFCKTNSVFMTEYGDYECSNCGAGFDPTQENGGL